MAKINNDTGVDIFETRGEYRKLFKEHDLKAEYITKTVRVEKEGINFTVTSHIIIRFLRYYSSGLHEQYPRCIAQLRGSNEG